MKTEDQIKALAELDGWKQGQIDPAWWSKLWSDDSSYTHSHEADLPNYLTSYDAIIPLIQKQEVGVRAIIAQRHPRGITFMSAPAQLCEALLRSTGKWIEEGTNE